MSGIAKELREEAECLATLVGIETFDLMIASADRIEHLESEVASVLVQLDELAAECWGDEGVLRRCRDRLRALAKGGGE